MILSTEEREFIEQFDQGIYQPELLFDETDILERIKEHPMAIWKASKQMH
jgi:hypothetical protein